ncbi:serine hydrolase domain-containing protein [Lactobacillus intestinalis]|uniref:serine hydrolase domain-containing protein n=1 Tax=Lactobacillus intestinalis TaxID=151781 RepID=UPI001F5933CB|nr:serine hydrolase domain-containing protein [Lactobacillus intestinalis]
MRLKKVILGILLAIGALGTYLYVLPEHVHTGDKNLAQLAKDYMKWHHINGVMLVNGKNGQPIVVENQETTDQNQIVNANQLFPIASLQKIMTGTAIYQLQQSQQLDWNTPLSKYFPQIPGSDDITIRELMNHTSGLINNDRPASPLKNEKEQIAYTLKHIKYDHLHTWDYQDVDYELLAAIISKQMNSNYTAYIQNTFALPQVKDFPEITQNEVPQPMSNRVTWHDVTVTTTSDFGAGNLFMSPNDYWQFIYNNVLKNPAMITQYSQQAQSQQVAYFGGVYFSGNIIRANGSIPGYNSCFVANYKTKRMMMLFSNNINYWKLRRTSNYIMHHYMGYHPELRI